MIAVAMNLDFYIISNGSFITYVPFVTGLFVNKCSSIYPDWIVPSVSVECLTVLEIETTDCL